MKAGDVIRIRAAGSDGEWTLATVVLVSSPDEGSQQSVGLDLHGGAVRAGGGLIVGMLPITVDYANQQVTGLMGEQYEIEVESGTGN